MSATVHAFMQNGKNGNGFVAGPVKNQMSPDKQRKHPFGNIVARPTMMWMSAQRLEGLRQSQQIGFGTVSAPD